MKVGTDKKIKRLATLANISQKLRSAGQKIVLCHGVFDLVHPGHIKHFQSAKRHGDILIVTITADKYVNKGPGRPIFVQQLRAEVLAAIEIIDYVAIVNSPSSIDAIEAVKPDFYIKGPDYKNRKPQKTIPTKLQEEKSTVEKHGGKLIYTDDEIVFSSSKLISEYLDVYPKKTKNYLDAFKKKYTSEMIIGQFEKMSDIKALVIGDAIIDQYHYALPIGKSSKEPVLVHQYIYSESYIGGVLATANHIAALSKHVSLVTLLGKQKSFKNFIIRKLRPEVTAKFYFQSRGSTIIKRRFLDVNTKQKLFQISYMKDEFILPEKTEAQVLEFLDHEIPRHDLIVVNDFGHNIMTDAIIRLICRKANFLALNVQTNSANFGFNIVTKYPRADYICIDDQEIRLATHDKHGNLQMLIRKIYQRMRCRLVVVTKGPNGSLAYTKENGFYESPALTDKIVDRVGAGDALFAITAPCVYAGLPPEEVVLIGNVAGALKVQIMGNKSQIELVDMVKFINRLLK